MRHQIVRILQYDSRLMEGLDRLHQGLMAYGGRPDTPPEQFMDFVTKRFGDETMLLILCLARDTPIGYALAFDVAEHPFMPEWQRSGYITQIYVASEHRRQGVGKLLLDFIFQWLVSRGVTRVLLNISVDNLAGEQFWRKHSFEPVQIRMKQRITANDTR